MPHLIGFSGGSGMYVPAIQSERSGAQAAVWYARLPFVRFFVARVRPREVVLYLICPTARRSRLSPPPIQSSAGTTPLRAMAEQPTNASDPATDE
jgi:hypothetical protein